MPLPNEPETEHGNLHKQRRCPNMQPLLRKILQRNLRHILWPWVGSLATCFWTRPRHGPKRAGKTGAAGRLKQGHQSSSHIGVSQLARFCSTVVGVHTNSAQLILDRNPRLKVAHDSAGLRNDSTTHPPGTSGSALLPPLLAKSVADLKETLDFFGPVSKAHFAHRQRQPKQ